jgi:hypothetical protein
LRCQCSQRARGDAQLDAVRREEGLVLFHEGVPRLCGWGWGGGGGGGEGIGEGRRREAAVAFND